MYIIPISEEDPGYEEGGQSQGVYYTYIRGGSRDIKKGVRVKVRYVAAMDSGGISLRNAI